LVVLRVTDLILIECVFCVFFRYYSKLKFCSRITESLLTVISTFNSVHAHCVSLPSQTRTPKYKDLFCYPCEQLYNSACVSKYIVNRGEDQLYFLCPDCHWLYGIFTNWSLNVINKVSYVAGIMEINESL